MTFGNTDSASTPRLGTGNPSSFRYEDSALRESDVRAGVELTPIIRAGALSIDILRVMRGYERIEHIPKQG